MSKSVYDQIKKQNGERFAKAIRNYDNGVFDIPDIVDIVKYAGNEAEPILLYLISLKNIQIDEQENMEDPIALLDRAGYNAYYVNTLEEQNAISKYFEPDEMLCTFHDPTRFQKFHIINAVKKDVDKINRKDFKGEEEREDLYGTSVISIQVLTTGGFISIKNRYNHTVENPDNTFNSNPDNIFPGLSAAIKHYFNVDFSSQRIDLPNNFRIVNNHVIRYNYEINNIYFGEDFYVKDGRICFIDKDCEIMLDTCILNLKNRTIYDPGRSIEAVKIDNVRNNTGSFMSVLSCELRNKRLQIQKNKIDNSYEIFAEGESIVKTRQGEIIELNLPTTTEVGSYFLYENKALTKINMPNLKKIETGFLTHNEGLTKIDFPSATQIERNFLSCNKSLAEVSLPAVTDVGDYFLYANLSLKELSLPNLKRVGYHFLYRNKLLDKLDLPKLQRTGDEFLRENLSLTELDLPCLLDIGNDFLNDNQNLVKINLPELQIIGNNFLTKNLALTELCLPKVRKIERNFLTNNNALTRLEIPELKSVEYSFLYNNKTLEVLNFPNLECVGYAFLGRGTPLLKKLVVKNLSKEAKEELLTRMPQLQIVEKQPEKTTLERLKQIQEVFKKQRLKTKQKRKNTARKGILNKIIKAFSISGR